MKTKIFITILFSIPCVFLFSQLHNQSVLTHYPALNIYENKLNSDEVNLQQVKALALNAANWALKNNLDEMSYQHMCSAYGILKVADVLDNRMLRSGVAEALHPELLECRFPHRDNALRWTAHRWFGFVPLKLYIQTKDPSNLKRGIEMAEEQYIDADKYGMPGYTPRLFVDDIYGATVMQSLAYACTGDLKYLDRAIMQVLFYSGYFMQEKGLFLHSPLSPFFWARGNGWCAAAFPELLNVMPEDHPLREAVLLYYRRMMKALVGYQHPGGMWYQLLDDFDSWPETSGTAMFLFAMIEGVRNGWLPEEPYANSAIRAWNALSGYVDKEWRLTEISAGTGFGDRDYYLNRPKRIGDPHGQAPLLWAAASIIKWLDVND